MAAHTNHRPLTWRLILVICTLALVAAACGDSAPLTVEEAQSASGTHEVSGYVVADSTRVRICEALAESFPPQCGGASIDVKGLDLATIDALNSEQNTSWTDQPVTLSGSLDSGVLTDAERSEE